VQLVENVEPGHVCVVAEAPYAVEELHGCLDSRRKSAFGDLTSRKA
jgi:hypothetical protein